MNALAQSAPSAEPVAPVVTVPLLRTLVLCDLVDSTALVERMGDQRATDLFRKHDRLARALVHRHGGREIDKTDGFLMMFDRPIQAVAFALDYQRALKELNDNEKTSLASRVGIHVGDVLTWDNAPDDIAKGAKQVEVEGLVKPITSRLMQLALPNQILLSGVAHSLAHRSQGELGEQLATVRWRTHGRYRFKGIPDPIPVFEVGEEGHAPLKPPPWSGKAHREIPFWRRPATMGIEIGLLVLLLTIPAWYLFKPAPAIAFANRDWVVVGDLKNLTGEASFDEAIDTAFRIGLEQSRYVNVLSDLKTRETVRLMQHDPETTKLDRATGSEVALRDGARALILPTIAEVGGRVRITAEVVDPNTQTTVWSESADGTGAASILSSLDTINEKLRVRLGEALATVSRDSQPLEKVATKNLDALRAFTQGLHAYDVDNATDALTFFQQAVKIDPDFATARVMQAQVYINTNQNAAALTQVNAAIESADRLSNRDRMNIEAWKELFSDPNAAMDKWRIVSKLYPDFFRAQGAFGYFAWQRANRYADAMEAIEKTTTAKNPHRTYYEYLLAMLYLGEERYQDASNHFSEAAKLGLGKATYNSIAVLAAQRKFADEDRALAAQSGAAPKADRNLRMTFAADRGRWTDAVAALSDSIIPGASSTAQDQGGLDLVGLSLNSMTGTKIDTVAVDRMIAQDAALLGKSTPMDDGDAKFRIGFAAYLLATSGDLKSARHAMTYLPQAATSDSPTSKNMRIVAEAEIQRADHKAEQARSTLKTQALDGTELYLTHVALLNALRDAGDRESALKEAHWLANHRGRAFSEYNADWVARPYNVAQSNLALLASAEILLESGDKDRARALLRSLRDAWNAPVENAPLGQRITELEKRF